MILLNDKLITPQYFPDGTYAVRVDPEDAIVGKAVDITWKYDNDAECLYLWYLVNHIRNWVRKIVPIYLHMPYMPNARMDRVKNPYEIFTLKWFASFINSLGFEEVTVLDPHSNVSVALINNGFAKDASPQIKETLSHLAKAGKQDVLLCYPDEGAVKRYADLVHKDYVFGIKHRDWSTGKIQSLELTSPEKIAGRDVLIVDDICSRGGTFTYTAKALKDAGAKSIYLYVTHCENTIHEGSVLTDGLIEHVYTTDSIYRGEHEKITIL